jgi:hypothetical protein
LESRKKLSRSTPERHANLHGIFGYADRRLNQDIALRYRAAFQAEHRGESAKVNGAGAEALKKLNVFAWMASSEKPYLSRWGRRQVHQGAKENPGWGRGF